MPRKTATRLHTCIKPLLLSTSLIFSLPAYADTINDARQSFEKADYATSVIQLKNLLQENPENIEARLLIGRAYLKQYQADAAIKELEKARSLGAPTAEWITPLSRAYLLAGQNDKVIEAAHNLPDLPPAKQAQLYAAIGHAQLGKHQVVDARESFEQALQLKVSANAKVGLARVALLEQKVDKALNLLDEALELAPDNLDALLSKSQALAAKGQLNEAIEPLDHALTLQKRLQNARLMRAELYIRTNQLDKARAEAKTLIKQNPNNALAHFTLARLQLNDHEYAKAQTSAEKALRTAPNHPMSQFILGAAHYAQQNYQQAQLYLEKFISAQPYNLIGNRLLGAIYLQQGAAEQTVELLQNFTANTDIEDAQLLSLLGQAYLQTGNYSEGTESLNRALALAPEITSTRTQLAIGQIASGDIDKAISALESAVSKPDATEQTSIMLILSYLNNKQVDKAFAAIEAANQRYPDKGVFLNLKGLAHENLQEPEAAREAYQQALKADPRFIPALLSLAKLDIKAQDFNDADKQLHRALDADKNHLQTLLLLAQLAQLTGDTEDMLDWLSKARDRNPENVIPVSMLTNYYLSSGQPEKAQHEALSYYTNEGKSLTSLSLMANVSAARGKVDEARSYLQEIVATYPTDIQHRLQLAQLLINAEEYSQALVYLDEVIALQPSNGAALAARAGALIASAKLEDAESAIETFANVHPGHFMVDRLQGDLLLAQADPKGALAAYSRAFSQAKTTYLALKLSRLHEELGDIRQSTQLLSEYLQTTPNDQQIRTLLASLYQRLGDNNSAISEYEKIVSATPANVIAQNNLAWLYMAKHSPKALDTAEKAYRLTPENAAVIDTYGWIMLHQGDKKEALALIRKAVSKSPSNPDIRYHLAQALADNGNREQAKKEVSRLLRDYSDFEEKSAATRLAETLE
ncbi:MAG: PEP-CTERM system TPR-repeat protein PrsT [Pseudomonadales bacterium]